MKGVENWVMPLVFQDCGIIAILVFMLLLSASSALMKRNKRWEVVCTLRAFKTQHA